VSAGRSELQGEFFSDAGRGAGDEDGFGTEEGVGHGGIVYRKSGERTASIKV